MRAQEVACNEYRVGGGVHHGNAPLRIAITIYVLVAIVKKRLKTKASHYTILQIPSLTLFEKITLDQLLTNIEHHDAMLQNPNQLILFS